VDLALTRPVSMALRDWSYPVLVDDWGLSPHAQGFCRHTSGRQRTHLQHWV